MTMTFGVLALSVEDYATIPPLKCIMLTGATIVTFLWFLELIFRPIVGPALAWYCTDPSLRTDKERIRLGRCIMIVCAMSWLTWTGYQTCAIQGGFDTIRNIMPMKSVNEGGHHDVHANRIYTYLPAAQRLCLFHAAWEVKSFIDSWVHKDGLLLLAHHVGAFLVSSVCMQPVYHTYVCYFLGLSELSSIPLPIVAMLDETLGLGPPGLGKQLPILKNISSISFAVLFMTVRVVIWIVIASKYFEDGLAVVHGSFCKSEPIIWFYLVAMGLFTLLQLVWAVDLVRAVYEFLVPKPVDKQKGS